MPSSSLFLGVGAVLSTLSSTAFANKYTLQDTYDASNWLSEFNFDTNDYNNGFVNYLDHQDAVNANLFGTTPDGLVEFGIDSTTYLDASATGRNSVKFLGNTQYNHGLFVLDVKSMPGGCGSWPSFWALGPNPWPSNGEVDIIEGVNNQQDNQYTLHTSTQCTVAGTGQTAIQTTTDCSYDSAGSAGCAAVDQRASTYGNGLVTTGGGYYVMEWTSAAIKVWYFSHTGGIIPPSLTTANPDTSEFGTPAANFQGPNCNIDQRFNNMQFVFTNNLCGDWAGNVYGQSTCPQYTDSNGAPLGGMASCKQYVRNNPSTYANKWQIGSLKAFKASTAVSSSSSSSRSSTRSSTRSSSSTKSSSSSTRSSSTMHTTTSSVRSSSSSVRSSSSVASSTAHSSSSVRSSSSSSARVTSSTKTSSSSARSTSSSKASSSVASSTARATSSSKASSSVRSSSSSKQSSTSTAFIRGLAAATSSVGSSQSSAASAPVGPSLISPSSVAQSSSASSAAGASTVTGSASVAGVSTSAGGIVSVQAYPTSSASSSSSRMTVPPYPISNSTTPVTSYPAVNTPCSTSANPAYQTSSIPSYPGYPVSPSSAPGYPAYPNSPSSAPGYPAYPNSPSSAAGYPGYSVSASVPAYGAAPYPSQPANNGYGGYPVVTSQPSNGYNGYPPSGGSKTTITTTYTTTYVDVCSTGYTTITTTHPVTYCPTTTPAAQPTPGSGYPAVPPPGFQVTTKVCNYGCGSGPTTVTLTVPCTNCGGGTGSYPVTSKPSKSHTKTKTVHTKKTKTTPVVQAYSTKVITLQVFPVPISQYYASVSAAAAASYAANNNPSKPSSAAVASYPANVPSKPSVAVVSYPVQTPAASTVPKPPAISGYNAVVNPSGNPVNAASKTGSYPAQYTGAAGKVQVGALALSVVAAFAAMML